MKISLMEEKDIPAVALLEKEIFSRPWKEQDFYDALQKKENLYFAAWQQGIVGYIGIWTSFETADLCNMAVAPDKRRCKAGDMLLKAGMMAARERGVRDIFLEVRESNVPAICLYRNNHFKEIGIRKNYYHAPEEDALLMQCRLQ